VRAFSLKGALTGLLTIAAIAFPLRDTLLKTAAPLFRAGHNRACACVVSGFSVHRRHHLHPLSGVRKELRLALPWYATALTIAAGLLIMHRLSLWGLS
jgi:hypothetical protein